MLKSQINDMDNYLIHIGRKILQVTKPVLTTGQQNQSISLESSPEHTILQIHTLVYCSNWPITTYLLTFVVPIILHYFHRLVTLFAIWEPTAVAAMQRNKLFLT